jgi:hypothetical protein
MRRVLFVTVLLSLALTLSFVAGCDKERIVESSEIIREVEYVTLPPDTIFRTDTVLIDDSVTVHSTDTVVVTNTDTVFQVNVVYETDTITVTVHDTVTVTVTVHDTTTIVEQYWDTVTVTSTDTVLTGQCYPEEYTALGALQYHCDPLVMILIEQQFGLTNGWIYYLTSNQLAFTRQSANVYDIYGYIEYWTTDWSGYYPLEFDWRLTFTGSDPSNPTHWTMTEATTSGSSGLKIVTEPTDARRSLR